MAINYTDLLAMLNDVNVSVFYVNKSGEILFHSGEDEAEQKRIGTSIYQYVDDFSEKRLENVIAGKTTQTIGTTDIYMKTNQTSAACFLKYKRDQVNCWLVMIPYPSDYNEMVENVLGTNAELARLFDEKLNLEMELKQKIHELKIASITDPLTKLYNRQYFYEYLFEYLTKDSWSALSIIMIDFNDFKQVNDNYGHKAGDELLIQFAEMIHQHCHMGFRFGGDEFVIISVDHDQSYIKEKLDTISRSFNTQTSIVTLSYGMTFIDQEQRKTINSKADIDYLLKVADEQMYRNKRQVKKNERKKQRGSKGYVNKR